MFNLSRDLAASARSPLCQPTTFLPEARTLDRDRPPTSRVRAADAGNSLGQARVLRLTPGVRSLANRVGQRDPDFYRLVVPRESDVSVLFRNFSNVSIRIAALDQRGRVIGDDDNRLIRNLPARSSATLNLDDVSRGTYYFRITSARANNRYSLRITTRLDRDDRDDDRDDRDDNQDDNRRMG